jgi:SAM-dependent methyltransferase
VTNAGANSHNQLRLTRHRRRRPHAFSGLRACGAEGVRNCTLATIEPTYIAEDWRQQDARLRTGWLKRAIYAAARPLLSASARRKLAKATLRELDPTLVLRTRGFPLETRRSWGLRGLDPSRTSLLVQGTGTGWDVISWAEHGPEKLVATDLYDFSAEWADIKRRCQGLGVDVEFRQAPLEDHSFLASGSIDLCASDAVYEHCVNLEAVMRETHRVLRPGGLVYATYGPMWFSAGGDHFSGRGGLEHVFNHLLLDHDSYRRYFAAHLTHAEDSQSGGRYVELDLFSRLATQEYLEIYRRAGFEVLELILEVSDEALAFKGAYPASFERMAERHRERCGPDDFLIKGNFVRLRKLP